MTIRKASRAMTGTPADAIVVTIGYGRDGQPRASLYSKGRNSPITPLASPGQVRGLIDDLQAALAHLDGADL